jgi:deoxyribonuclease V
MHVPPAPHRWKVTPRQAVAWQRRLAPRVEISEFPSPFALVAGVDLAFTNDGRACIAGAVVWDVARGAIVERRVARAPVTFPYVPGLLSFREAPAVLRALRKLTHTPDALMCDGHGWAHPRRFGLACHVGIITGLPTLGCAKSRLVGEHRAPGPRRGACVRLMDAGERVGSVLRTRDNVKPVYVSVGHRMSLKQTEQLVLRCTAGYRLPEPTRQADHLVTETRRS